MADYIIIEAMKIWRDRPECCVIRLGRKVAAPESLPGPIYGEWAKCQVPAEEPC
jgi:hypothetical protein